MPEFLKILPIICPLVLLAGFVDSVAGGGGLISLPAYLFVGLPIHLASGTNKIVNCIGTSAAAAKYIKEGKVNFRFGVIAAIFAVAGSLVGTNIAVYLDASILNIIILCALPVVAITLTLNKNFGKTGHLPQRNFSVPAQNTLCAVIGLVIGCYDGMIGPGTGTFLMMAFTLVLGTDLLTSSGCAKIGNLASNVAAVIVWVINGEIYWELVLPAACCSVLGNYLGAKYAIRGGSEKIRGMIFVVLGLLFLKLIYNMVF